MVTESKTRGEVLIEGLATIRSGLTMVRQAGGNENDLIRLLITDRTSIKQLRELVQSPGLLREMVYGMVRARNSRLARETVDKIINDFLQVMDDLAQPVAPAEGEGGEQP